MCLACEEQEYFFRQWCGDFIARGEMPPGVTEEDLAAMGLRLPNVAATATTPPAARKDSASGAFVCDSPDE